MSPITALDRPTPRGTVAVVGAGVAGLLQHRPRRDHAPLAGVVPRGVAGPRLGFDETFPRMWEFHLAYCEAGSATSYLDVAQIRLTRKETR